MCAYEYADRQLMVWLDSSWLHPGQRAEYVITQREKKLLFRYTDTPLNEHMSISSFNNPFLLPSLSLFGLSLVC